MPILHPYADRELRVARLRLLRLRDELCLIRRDRFHRKYNPNQPRVPSGNAGGGQWTSGAGGGGGSSPADPLSPDGSSLGDDTGWSSLGEGWNEDGSIFEQAVTDGKGTTIQSEYAASRAVSFDERQTRRDGAAGLFETRRPPNYHQRRRGPLQLVVPVQRQRRSAGRHGLQCPRLSAWRRYDRQARSELFWARDAGAGRTGLPVSA